MTALALPQLQARLQPLIDAHKDRPGALLPLLHAVQDALGHVPDEVVPLIAPALNLSRAEVHGVISYYHHFRRTPPGRHVLQICRAEACRACGSEALAEAAQRILGCDDHATRADGAVTVEPVYCLGLCAQSPAATFDGQPIARCTPQRLQALADAHGLNPADGAPAATALSARA
ncbi:formate dehydrogenase subunit gamma [Pseudaquabacterium rugosum]|uniref:Formate dehydrogenase subunit gamma n=1 Tax=Pseudaquabacterium rugosum TaxID=2984194 RepID=A0ABU9B9G2_9BURK